LLRLKISLLPRYYIPLLRLDRILPLSWLQQLPLLPRLVHIISWLVVIGPIDWRVEIL